MLHCFDASLTRDYNGLTVLLINSGGDYHSMVKRTWQPRVRRRARVHGFRKRMASPGGRKVIKARRAHGRKQLSV